MGVSFSGLSAAATTETLFIIIACSVWWQKARVYLFVIGCQIYSLRQLYANHNVQIFSYVLTDKSAYIFTLVAVHDVMHVVPANLTECEGRLKRGDCPGDVKVALHILWEPC